MKKSVFKPTFLTTVRAAVAPLLLTLAVIAVVVVGLDQAGRSSRAEGLRILDQSIRRAAVKCYSIEGSYPSDIAYIEEHYGIHIDKAKYVVHYEIFASNVMPDIVVLELD